MTRTTHGEPIAMTISISDQTRVDAGIPDEVSCAACGAALAEPFGWCSNCRVALCLACGQAHFCTATCQRNGCIAGLCVRLVDGGRLSSAWGLPADR